MKYPRASVLFRTEGQEAEQRRSKLSKLLADPVWLEARDAALLEMTVMLQSSNDARQLLSGAHTLLGLIESLAEPLSRKTQPADKLPQLP